MNCTVFFEITTFLVNETTFYPTIPTPERDYTLSKRKALAHALLDWAGFAKLEPMTKSQYNSDQENVPIERIPMRNILHHAARITGRPDPSFASVQVSADVQTREVEIRTEKEDNQTNSSPAPVLRRSRAWSLPSPPSDSSTPSSPLTHSKTIRSAEAKAPAGTAAGDTVRKQQIIAKVKQTKQRALQKQQKINSTDGAETQRRGTQSQEWTTSKKESREQLKEDPEHAKVRNRIWDVVKGWF